MTEQAPEGTIIIKRGHDLKLYNIADLVYMHELTIGQLFIAVARANNKVSSDYGIKWVKFRNNIGDISHAFISMKKELDQCATDFEKLNMVAAHLGENAFCIEA